MLNLARTEGLATVHRQLCPCSTVLHADTFVSNRLGAVLVDRKSNHLHEAPTTVRGLDATCPRRGTKSENSPASRLRRRRWHCGRQASGWAPALRPTDGRDNPFRRPSKYRAGTTLLTSPRRGEVGAQRRERGNCRFRTRLYAFRMVTSRLAPRPLSRPLAVALSEREMRSLNARRSRHLPAGRGEIGGSGANLEGRQATA